MWQSCEPLEILIRVAIKDGKVEEFSMPKDSANPRLSLVGETIVITETFGSRAPSRLLFESFAIAG
jgi:hypothetical protein